MTNESENVLPTDDKLWDYIEEMGYSIGISVSDSKTLDILGALEDIYVTVDEDIEDAKRCIIALAAIFIGSSTGTADAVWQEFSVQEAMKDLDKGLKEILNEKP